MKPTPARVAYETQQFFEIDLPEGADPATYPDTPEGKEHLADLILSGFVGFAVERLYDDNGNEAGITTTETADA